MLQRTLLAPSLPILRLSGRSGTSVDKSEWSTARLVQESGTTHKRRLPKGGLTVHPMISCPLWGRVPRRGQSA
jgi:hypothetical protein